MQSLDCRLVAEPSSSQCGMEQVIFPKPGPQEPTQRLLSQLERGVLVASNSRGLFVQRLCPIPVSWSAPQVPPGPGPHLLPSNECVELFRTTYFFRGEAAAAQHPSPYPYFLGSPGPAPTLNSLHQIHHHSPCVAPCTCWVHILWGPVFIPSSDLAALLPQSRLQKMRLRGSPAQECHSSESTITLKHAVITRPSPPHTHPHIRESCCMPHSLTLPHSRCPLRLPLSSPCFEFYFLPPFNSKSNLRSEGQEYGKLRA